MAGQGPALCKGLHLTLFLTYRDTFADTHPVAALWT